MRHILKYFPDLSVRQRHSFETMLRLYPQWNAKINVISRKDIDNLEINHLLHSLAIARFVTFADGSRVLDLGSGGGLPGLPLAAIAPQAHFLLVDRIGKKLRVAQDIAREAALTNVEVRHADIGEVRDRQFDFIVSRAVMDLRQMVPLVRRLVRHGARSGVPNGLICLKGGDLSDELAPFAADALVEDIGNYFAELPFFQTKKLIYLPL